MSGYTKWYRDGSASAVKGSKIITGSGTYWESAGINPGDLITFDNGFSFTEIAEVNSDTSITLATDYSGSSITGAAYAIVRNFTATMPAKIAAQVTEVIGDFKKKFDAATGTVKGKSAYEVAKDNGFVGTEAQWLETLKVALATDSEMDEVMNDIFGNDDDEELGG